MSDDELRRAAERLVGESWHDYGPVGNPHDDGIAVARAWLAGHAEHDLRAAGRAIVAKMGKVCCVSGSAVFAVAGTIYCEADDGLIIKVSLDKVGPPA